MKDDHLLKAYEKARELINYYELDMDVGLVIGDFIEKIEKDLNLKITIYEVSFKDLNNKHKSEICGAILKEKDQMSILIEESDSPSKKRFTILHELGHFYLNHLRGEEPLFDFRSNFINGELPADNILDQKEEEAANAFALELLIPSKILIDLHESYNFSNEDISKAFGVSISDVLSQLRYLNLV